MNGAGTNGAASRRTLPHIHDITSAVTVNRDLSRPLRRILEEAQSRMNNANAAITFKRPERALWEFLCASKIIVEVVPRHKDFGSLRDRKDQQTMYQTLMRELKTRTEVFEDAKAQIVADNARTGVQPNSQSKNAPASSSNQVQHSRSQSESRGTLEPRDDNILNGLARTPSPQKAKPSVNPKPAALQGHTLQKTSGTNGTKVRSDDLMARFQNLRTSVPAVQDPRIKTHPIVIPVGTPGPTSYPRSKPSGPREMPSLCKERDEAPFKSIDSMPSLPKMPAAIYNPARGSMTTQSSNLPSSTPRGMFSRTNSVTSVSGFSSNGVSTPPATTSSKDDYFTPAHSISIPKPKPTIPQRDTITGTDLRNYMNLGTTNFNILILDVRPRSDFDDGHIMHHSTICIEPLMLREDISADEIGDRMVLDSRYEMKLYERRDRCDLVVMYDNRSQKIPSRLEGGNDALRYLRDALVLYDDERPLKAQPKLLEGGLEAWIDEMGPHSLMVSEEETHRVSLTKRPHALALKDYSRKVVHLPDREIRKWQDLLEEEENNSESAFTAVRSTDDFLRRFPDVNSMQESMSSKRKPPTADGAAIGSMFPPVPSRPAPALPRPSLTGLADDGVDTDHQPTGVSVKMSRAVGRLEPPMIPTNLQNEGATCYADSLLQLLVASMELTSYLVSGRWMELDVRVKNQDGQIKRHPQILTRILAGLFQHLQSGAVRSGVKATMLRRYMGDLVKHTSSIGNFGSATDQQDITEYFQILINYLDNETNPRSIEEKHYQKLRGNSNDEPPFQFAARWFSVYQKSQTSLVDSFLTFTLTESKTCSCGHVDATTGTCITEPGNLLIVGWPDDQHNRVFRLEDLIANQIHSDQQVSCESCGARKKVVKKFSSLPKYLFISFTRYVNNHGQLVKHHTPVEFPVGDDLDMTNFMWPNEGRWGSLPPQMEGPFNYELYGMAMHQGMNMHSGHYTAYVRKQSPDWREWWYLNDLSGRGAEDFKLRGDMHTGRLSLVQQFSQGVGDVTMLCYRRTMRNPHQKQMQQR
ncbi:ubiquitin carboxyl-terminal hydrolase [Zalerion maritima]|uniref:ubiquitinyl hydrolase 1 n=1 Tax=Zalerion maritima TaxID=339359 RepID=A0AAD5RXV7_9PEZI|nr:ubiquitin carboxyl-terminal hydrolase [Zalerion maritima]